MIFLIVPLESLSWLPTRIGLFFLFVMIIAIKSYKREMLSVIAGSAALVFMLFWVNVFSALPGSTYYVYLLILSCLCFFGAFIENLAPNKIALFFTRKRIIALGVILLCVAGAVFVPQLLSSFAYAESDEKASTADARVVTANTRFAVAIMQELSREDHESNVFISPLSITNSLAMALNGANGTTKEAMTRTLGLEDMTLDEYNEGTLTLLESLASVDEKIQLNIANSIWIREAFAPKVRQDYTSTVTDYFKSEVYTRPFDQTTITDVNNWISGKTNQKIPRMLESIDQNDVLFLINAIYFKGDWASEFKEEDTRPGTFYLSDGSTTTVDFMHQDEEFNYFEGRNYQAARLPYGRGKVAMYIFLPDKGVMLDSFVEEMTQPQLDAAFTKFHKRELVLSMPKFKIEYGTKRLNEALTNLGMGVAFNWDEANFSRIAPVSTSQNLYISFVDHKAYVDVNEKGTEAAAATITTVTLSSATSPIYFKVDRPFFFVIRDDRTGTILFMGKIENPLKTSSP